MRNTRISALVIAAVAVPWLLGSRGCEPQPKTPANHGGSAEAGAKDASTRTDAGVRDDGSTATSGSDASRSVCGTRGGVECAANQFCNFEPDPDCGGTDRGGTCEVRPQMCTREYLPVCGCDRKTYGNRCTAHADGVSVLHEGACTVSDCKAIGGRAVDGIGPPPQCAEGEVKHTDIVHDDGAMSIEGTACCVPAT